MHSRHAGKGAPCKAAGLILRAVQIADQAPHEIAFPPPGGLCTADLIQLTVQAAAVGPDPQDTPHPQHHLLGTLMERQLDEEADEAAETEQHWLQQVCSPISCASGPQAALR